MTFSDDFVTIHHGDCLDVMHGMEPDSIDAIVTDPPYGLSFMGREWDHGVPGEAFWQEALRVAKPGCHLVAFGGTRTYHRLAVAIEDAGWEVRDCLGWLYGSGFPKSLDVSKAIDKEAGAERAREKCGGLGSSTSFADDAWTQEHQGQRIVNEPITAAAAWSGWGTALKPAWEPIILARKPLTGTVAANVQRWGTGAINIDGCRIETDEVWDGRSMPNATDGVTWGGELNQSSSSHPLGRWPANIVHDGSDEVLAVFPQAHLSPFASSVSTGKPHDVYGGGMENYTGRGFSDSGSAARFFYCAKADKRERDDGLYDFPEQEAGVKNSSGRGYSERDPYANIMRRNIHPTVKPLDLMRWLVRLVTPPDGIVLDPFMGSGTTLKAARAEGHRSIGIDLEREHCEIAWGRLSQGVLL